MKNIIAIIPARGGSKRVPRKNVRELVGKPLIAWTIEAAKKSKYIDKVIVSTDDDEIEEISKRFGAQVIRRPIEIAGDKSPTIDALIHVIKILEEKDYNPELIVLLQPTSPLRDYKDIDGSIELFNSNDSKSVVSGNEENPFWNFKIEDGKANPLFGWEYFSMRSQDIPKVFSPNGAIYVTTTEELIKNKGFYNNNLSIYIMPKEKSADIDEEIDFKIATILMENENN